MNIPESKKSTSLTCILLLFALSLPFNVMGNNESKSSSKTAVLGGGCFWCIEALYDQLDGVLSVVSGYAGGHIKNPDYRAVCTGDTGHAEVVRIEYDPAKISYRELIDFFWQAHDPTTKNRQGADVGPQYRSIILYENQEQETIARESLENAQSGFDSPIVTELKALETFYKAEVAHQDYYANNPNAPYCRYVIAPKLEKLKKGTD